MQSLYADVGNADVVGHEVGANEHFVVPTGFAKRERIYPYFRISLRNGNDFANLVFSKYLAYILNTEIPKITQSLSGSKIPSVGRGDLEEIQIPILPIEKQRAIGDFWQKSVELYKLKRKLDELELTQAKGILENAINGGK